MALPRRLQLKLEDRIRKESEAVLNRWLFIGFMALSIAELGANLMWRR
jgi:hypothetical protein